MRHNAISHFTPLQAAHGRQLPLQYGTVPVPTAQSSSVIEYSSPPSISRIPFIPNSVFSPRYTATLANAQLRQVTNLTRDQERHFENELFSWRSQAGNQAHSEAELRWIYDWVLARVHSENSEFQSSIVVSTWRERTASQVLRDGQAHCSGYVYLLNALLRKAAYDFQVVYTDRHPSDPQRRIQHVFVQVTLSNRRLDLDPFYHRFTSTSAGVISNSHDYLSSARLLACYWNNKGNEALSSRERILAYQRAIALDPENTSYRANLACIYREQFSHPETSRGRDLLLRQWGALFNISNVNSRPDSRFHFERALFLSVQRRPQEAEVALRFSLQQDIDNTETRKELILLMIQNRRAPEQIRQQLCLLQNSDITVCQAFTRQFADRINRAIETRAYLTPSMPPALNTLYCR